MVDHATCATSTALKTLRRDSHAGGGWKSPKAKGTAVPRTRVRQVHASNELVSAGEVDSAAAIADARHPSLDCPVLPQRGRTITRRQRT
jgi:hypothetical protein